MTNPRSRKRPAESPSPSINSTAPEPNKKPKHTPSSTPQTDDDGNQYWEISGKRRLQITDFKGQTFINIREFYEKDGKALPGKKGIALSVEQYRAFVELLPAIEGVLEGKGVEVARPVYDGAASGKVKDVDEAEDEEGEGGEQDEEGDGEEGVGEEEEGKKDRLDTFKFGGKGKKNYEATSDEDEGD